MPAPPASPVPCLRIADFVPPGAHWHLVRQVRSAAGSVERHGHDFPEAFWVEAGELAHGVNRASVRLGPGDLVLIRPGDEHALTWRGRVVWVNLAFPAEVLDELRGRYFPDTGWPWAGGGLPATARLDREALHRLSARAERLSGTVPRTRLALDRFLICLLDDLATSSAPLPWDDLPPWMAEGLRRWRESPDARLEGVAALSRLTGRSREHLNRTARAAVGLTTTGLLNHLRLEQAAADLRMTGKAPAEIAYDCGLPNLGHFYKLFRRRFGHPPARYRTRQRAIQGGLGEDTHAGDHGKHRANGAPFAVRAVRRRAP